MTNNLVHSPRPSSFSNRMYWAEAEGFDINDLPTKDSFRKISSAEMKEKIRDLIEL